MADSTTEELSGDDESGEPEEVVNVPRENHRQSAGPGLVVVSRTIKDKNGEHTDEKEDYIEVGTFVTEPAIVTIKKGLTINLGDYESARIDVGVSLPCYKEEIPAALETATRVVEAYLMREKEELADETS